MFPFTFTSVGMIALAIVVIAGLFKIYGVTLRNFVLIVIGVTLVSLVLMKQTDITYYTHLVLHTFTHSK